MTFENRYGFVDRALHDLAFKSTTAQLGLADLEDRMFRREVSSFEAGPPVFVTALPRAGTTILLELLGGHPEFATHTYRDMPFVLCPMLWNRIASPFRRASKPIERAHADGIRISADSPEAFEEIVWMRFFREHYEADVCRPWSRCDVAQFVEFFAAHRRKIIALRRRQKSTATRYASKNNLNIARVPAIFSAVPNATVVVLFREPAQHAASLLEQHSRFSDLHQTDAFARRYMRGLGHFDFGMNLRPVDFDGWFRDRTHSDDRTIGFWLEYWSACYERLWRTARHEQVVFLPFEELPSSAFPWLGRRLGVTNLDAWDAAHAQLKRARTRECDVSGVDRGLLDRVRSLYAEMFDASKAALD